MSLRRQQRAVNTSQHGVSAAGQLVTRFWAVTSCPCDELTGSHNVLLIKQYLPLTIYTTYALDVYQDTICELLFIQMNNIKVSKIYRYG